MKRSSRILVLGTCGVALAIVGACSEPAPDGTGGETLGQRGDRLAPTPPDASAGDASADGAASAGDAGKIDPKGGATEPPIVPTPEGYPDPPEALLRVPQCATPNNPPIGFRPPPQPPPFPPLPPPPLPASDAAAPIEPCLGYYITPTTPAPVACLPGSGPNYEARTKECRPRRAEVLPVTTTHCRESPAAMQNTLCGVSAAPYRAVTVRIAGPDVCEIANQCSGRARHRVRTESQCTLCRRYSRLAGGWTPDATPGMIANVDVDVDCTEVTTTTPGVPGDPGQDGAFTQNRCQAARDVFGNVTTVAGRPVCGGNCDYYEDPATACGAGAQRSVPFANPADGCRPNPNWQPQ